MKICDLNGREFKIAVLKKNTMRHKKTKVSSLIDVETNSTNKTTTLPKRGKL